MKRTIKTTLIILLVVFVVMQFIRPEKNISDVVPATDLIVVTKPPKEVQDILKTSCYDCHSNNTNYPWYSNVAPISYWISDHIKHGKGNLNFSEWDTYSVKKKAHKLEELTEEVEKHEMPLESYLRIHKDAKLSNEQIETLTNWANNLRFIHQLGVK
ncbi:cytochrome C [Flavobacteriaceae bacterium R38]|nr:cytochrome C [Flavobacteriaceae bacterium R38]